MKHFGDITKIHGDKVPIVDIITGGSPCQDLSVAGKRAGLDGKRSGLFIEQIRIIKEMRDESRRQLSIRRADVDVRDIRPRYMVWENVPGAFSSNGGEDFRAVLEETARISNPTTSIPRLPSGESWSNAGCILGDRWSIAWRVHDAQFWGVPQRRKRIALVADFGGQSAPEILFESSSLQGNTEQGKQERQRSPTTTRKCSNKTSSFMICYRKKSHPINENLPQNYEETEVSDTLNVFDNSEKRTPILILENHPHDSRIKIVNTFQTLSSRMGTGGNNTPMTIQNSKIRRLTPLECERLQGFPDNWTKIGPWTDSKGKPHKNSDSYRYIAIGNSLALPFWEWMAYRMCKQLREDGFKDLSMASLFDGIGGFPLVYSRCGCKPVWASEIEEFPIAVTKYHFGEE